MTWRAYCVDFRIVQTDRSASRVLGGGPGCHCPYAVVPCLGPSRIKCENASPTKASAPRAARHERAAQLGGPKTGFVKG